MSVLYKALARAAKAQGGTRDRTGTASAPVIAGSSRGRFRLRPALLAVAVAVIVLVGAFLIFGDTILSGLDQVQDHTAHVAPPPMPPALIRPAVPPVPGAPALPGPPPVPGTPSVSAAPPVPGQAPTPSPPPAAANPPAPGTAASTSTSPASPSPAAAAPATVSAPPAAVEAAPAPAPAEAAAAPSEPEPVPAQAAPPVSTAPIVSADQNLPAIIDRIRQEKAAQGIGTNVVVAMGQGAKPGGAHTELRDADGQPIVSVTSAEPSDRDRTDSAYDMLMRGQYQGALDLYDSVLKSAPANFSALLGRATALHKLRRYGDARIAYRAVLAVDPQNPQALTNMMAIVADGQPDQALSELRDMARQYPSFSPINAAIADIEMRQGDTQGALADYGRAISASPENGLYRLNLAIIQDHAGMKRDAADSYARALQLLASGDSLPVPVAQIQARLRYLQSQ